MKLCVLFSALLIIQVYSVNSASILLDDAESIDCVYSGGTDGANYECTMTINNPNGIEFDAVGGTHLDGFTNEDVLVVNAYYGQSSIVPSVICRQFPNIFHLTVMGLGVEELTPAAFANCGNLTEIFLVFNEITAVPANTFSGCPRLDYIELSRNNINQLNANSFAGTALSFIVIDYNQINEFNQEWFTAVNGTLRHLELLNNQIREIGADAFSNLRNLRELNFNFNVIGPNIASTAFDGLTNLQTLSISRTAIPAIDPAWFRTLESLTMFYAQNNEISELANGTFASLTTLERLFLNGNRIREITREAFGNSSSRLHTFYINDNRINVIDPYWVNDADNLEYLLLAGNLCVDEDFLNVGLLRWRLFEELQQCIDNFMLEPWIDCRYQISVGTYICHLNTHNPHGIEFDVITGDHMEGQSDESVSIVDGIFMNTRTIPSIICRQFPSLTNMFLLGSNIEEISEESLSGCSNLVSLFLHNNRIREVPDFVFQNTPNLLRIDLGINEIETLGENAFAGTAVQNIDLDINRLTSINQKWAQAVNESLTSLILFGNSIVMLEFDVFENLGNLQILIIGDNPIWSIPANVFDPLVSLTILDLRQLSLITLNPSWFLNLNNLERLQLSNNQLEDLQDGIFDPLTNLRVINLNDNNLRSLSSVAFGSSLSSVVDILVENNRIRAVDERILDEATDLIWFYLRGNICSQENFSGVFNNVEFVRNQLRTCTTNFGPETLECRYYQPGAQYTCSLSIFNPLGRDEFDDIGGEHMDGRTDDDVQVLYVNQGQKTLNVPSILCAKFQNLISMDFTSDQIEILEEGTFGRCVSLRRIYIYDNLIESLPIGLFSNNPELEEVNFGHNRLTARGIPANIFQGTRLHFLDLSQNPIQDFNSAWIIPVASTLRTLEIYDIGATHLPVLFFNNPSVLEVLEVGRNPLREIVPAVFDRLPTLRFLDLGSCLFRQINAEWFRELRQLETLRISDNQVLDIPPNTFDALTNLTTIYIYSNKLRELNVASFGASIATVRFIYAQFNEISGIDPDFLTSATSLQILYLAENRCARENFYNVNNNTAIVAEAIEQCTETFNAETLRCLYVMSPQGVYTCIMKTFNPLGRDDFYRISGEHVDGYDDDVTVVEMRDQETRIIPSIICCQFPNLRALMIFHSQLDLFAERNLNECRNLAILMMYQNDLFEIPNFSFQNNENLEHLELGFNRIARLDDHSFTGAPIRFLDLAGNPLGIFNPRWFESINGTLEALDLLNANIQSLPENGFRNLRNLRSLALSRNPLSFRLPPRIFEGLDNLEDLFLSNCEITFVDPAWFRALGRLRNLFIDNNMISIIRVNSFNSLRSVTTINLANNFLWELSDEAFGPSLESLQIINLSNNMINLFNEQLITSAENLQRLYLIDNACANQNFINVGENLESVLNGTRRCVENFNAQPMIRCEYMVVGDIHYTCNLEVVDPRGIDLFGNIPGTHLPGRNDANVTIVAAYYQNTRIVQSQICRQFPNLLDLSIFSSNVQSLNSFMFSNCRNLRVLMINGGFIQVLPHDMFAGAPNLEYLSLAGNRIWAILDFAFAGTSIQTLDLAFNRISQVIPEVMDPIAETLTVLDMAGNEMRGFPIGTFENLRNIEELYLDRNPLTELFDETFLTLPNLRIMSMNDCQLQRLSPVMFYEMVNVHTLRLSDNRIDALPAGAFHNMTSLTMLYISNNRIGSLDAEQFGGAMTSITNINAVGNRINAIERDLISNSPNLNALLLAGNVCTDETFLNIQDDIEGVLEALNVCFDNFNVEPVIECTFDVTANDDYRCDVRVHNPVDEDFQTIGGQHMTGRADEDVLVVSMMSQNTKTFPSVICRQFVNLVNMLVVESGIEILEAVAFEGCRNLEQLYILQNRVATIPPSLFGNSPRLNFLSLASNRIRQVHPTAFTGTSIDFLDLAGNQIERIESAWFVPITRTLRTLDFFGNSIQRLPNSTFGPLSSLETLIIGGNHFILEENPFEGLWNLRFLGLDHCGIRELNPTWFQPIAQLRELDLNNNGIAELQSGIFSALVNILMLQIEDNLLTSISADAFGDALGNVQNLHFVHNIIGAIDPQLLDRATHLNRLLLEGNICVNQNFVNVTVNLEEVREQLQACFDNFN